MADEEGAYFRPSREQFFAVPRTLQRERAPASEPDVVRGKKVEIAS